MTAGSGADRGVHSATATPISASTRPAGPWTRSSRPPLPIASNTDRHERQTDHPPEQPRGRRARPRRQQQPGRDVQRDPEAAEQRQHHEGQPPPHRCHADGVGQTTGHPGHDAVPAAVDPVRDRWAGGSGGGNGSCSASVKLMGARYGRAAGGTIGDVPEPSLMGQGPAQGGARWASRPDRGTIERWTWTPPPVAHCSGCASPGAARTGSSRAWPAGWPTGSRPIRSRCGSASCCSASPAGSACWSTPGPGSCPIPRARTSSRPSAPSARWRWRR